MRRREFISLMGSAVANWPLGASAQSTEQAKRVGLLLGLVEGDPEANARIVAFRKGLEETGWTEGRNVRIDYRFAGGDPGHIQAYAKELLALMPDVIVAHSTPVVAALKKETSLVPIVFVVVNDPVGQGLVASLAHPGSNITGFTFVDFEMIGKCLNLLKEIAPAVGRVGLMFDPDLAPYFRVYIKDIATLSTSLDIELFEAPVREASEIEAVIEKLGTRGGLIVGPDPFTVVNREVITKSVERYRLPAIYTLRQEVLEGALMSYGPDTADIFQRSASYVDRVLKGTKPRDLPVQAPTKFELVINMKTAKALGLDVPSTLAARADEVVE
jgi:putative ABC transport system substrate-binding protein